MKAGDAIRPGTKVTITIEATVIQAYEGTATHIVYGDWRGEGRELILHPDEPGVTIKEQQ